MCFCPECSRMKRAKSRARASSPYCIRARADAGRSSCGSSDILASSVRGLVGRVPDLRSNVVARLLRRLAHQGAQLRPVDDLDIEQATSELLEDGPVSPQ